VQGVGDNRFAPDEAITRQEMATLLHNYIDHKGITLPGDVASAGAPGSGTFTDDTAIADWARDAVYAMYHAGIVSGMPGNLFEPGGVSARSHVAQLWMNLAGVVG
jgi:hypothetical protein